MKEYNRTSKDIYTESYNRLFPSKLPENIRKETEEISMKLDKAKVIENGVLTNVVEECGIKFIDTKKGLIPQYLKN